LINMKSTNAFVSRAARTVSAIGLSAAATMAMAAQPGNYAGIHGGRNDVGDWSANVSLGAGLSLPGSVGAERGAHWGVFGGRQTENARFELEYQRGDFDIRSISAGPLRQAVRTDGDYQALTANAYRTYDFNERFGAYAGLGIGWGKVKMPRMGFTGGCNCFPEASKSGFAYQARVGGEWHIAPTHNAFVQYTWLRLPRPSSGGAPGVEYSRKSVGAWTVGYRHEF